jgi:hypothetical protein
MLCNKGLGVDGTRVLGTRTVEPARGDTAVRTVVRTVVDCH